MGDYYSLKGQTAVVTGGATGLGLAITRCLISAGAKVVVLSRGAQEDAQEVLKEFGDRAVYYPFDITESDKAQEIADRIIKEHGPVSILVNNAGNHCKKYIWEMRRGRVCERAECSPCRRICTDESICSTYERESPRKNHFPGKYDKLYRSPQVAGYSTAKGGYLGLIHTLTAELAEYGITVNAIAPGWIDTPMFHKATDNDAPRLAKIIGRIPAKRGRRSDGCRNVCSLPLQ